MGDFSANFHRPESGIYSVEGNLAGNRAALLTKKRQAEQDQFEARKQKIRHDSEKASQNISSKFDTDKSLSSAERNFRMKTVGLVTAEEFKKAALEAKKGDKKKNKNNDAELGGIESKEIMMSLEEKKKLRKEKKSLKKKKLKKEKKMLSTLSFADSEDAEGLILSTASITTADTTKSSSKKEIKKNPNVDTSFLPDREREEAEKALRVSLKEQWHQTQLQQKKEVLEITYSYWDGSGHRRTVQVLKGDTIATFLSKVKKALASEFREMMNVNPEDLIYVKEDLIIPQDITFYDLIATKARGKSGPLFNFDVHDDVRIGSVDRRVEKDESHPGKVVERKWYDRNKHIFPASRWEFYDPSKDYGRYTIHGNEVN